MTALKLSAFDVRGYLQIGQALCLVRYTQGGKSANSLEKCATKNCDGNIRSYHICCVNGN